MLDELTTWAQKGKQIRQRWDLGREEVLEFNVVMVVKKTQLEGKSLKEEVFIQA